MTYDDLCRRIESRDPFAFSRWGDGEWHAILGRSGGNCDGHRYYPDMGEALGHALVESASDPKHIKGLQPLARDRMGDAIAEWEQEHNVSVYWHNADLIHDAAFEGRLDRFTAACGRMILVGPEHTAPIKADHVYIPQRDAWTHREDILRRTGAAMLRSPSAPVVLCCGMLAEWLVWILRLMDPNRVIVDAGSVFDPWGGRRARTYQRQYDIVARNPGVTS